MKVHLFVITASLILGTVCAFAMTEGNRTDDLKADALVSRARSEANMGNFEQAFYDADSAIRLIPSSPKGYVCRGNLRLRLGHYNTAISEYTRAIELHSDSAIYERGHAKRLTGDIKGAFADFDAAIRMHPTDPWSYWARGSASIELGDRAAARDDFQRVLSISQSRSDRYQCVRQLALEAIKVNDL